MFTPDLDLQVVIRCTKFRIIDNTGVDTGDGDKWDGVSGLDSSTITSAVIRIVNPSGDYTDYDVLSQIPTPVTDTFKFIDATGTRVDGLHNLIYRIKTIEKSITAYSDYNESVPSTTLVTSTLHGMVTGNYVQISESINYNGEFYVTVVDASRYYISTPFVADDATGEGRIMFINYFYPYVYCEAEAGIAKMHANVSMMVPGEARDKYLRDAETARGLLESLKSAMTSSNVTALDAILAEINQILSINSVDPQI